MKGMEMQKTAVFLFAAFVWIIGALLPAASADLTIPHHRQGPVIDGKGDDPCCHRGRPSRRKYIAIPGETNSL